MKTVVYLLAVCSVLLGGCSRTTQTQEPPVAEKTLEPPAMITVNKLTVTDANLTLDFRVSNPFDGDIWVCHDAGVYGKQDVQSAATRIDGEMVRIQLRSNTARFPGFVDPPSVAKYVRLAPRESHSGRIRRDLPVKDYVREWREDRKEHKEIVLHRAVFEVGYFGSEMNEYFASVAERSRQEPDKYKPLVVGPFLFLTTGPFITEESLGGRLRQVLYVEEYAPLVNREGSAEVFITNVNIPCSVVAEDK